MRQKRNSLTMAAAFAAALSVPAVATAGPKFEELERAVPAELRDAGVIADALTKALGADREAVRALQRECFGDKNPKLLTGALVSGGATQACIRDHADAMARARAHAETDRAAIEAELGTCKTGAGDCVKARDAAVGERDELKVERDELSAKLALGGGSCDPDAKPVAAVEAYANAHCAGGSQICWHSPTQFSCTDPRFEVVMGACAVDASGTSATCESQVKSAPGRGGVVPILVPPPPLEPKGTCDGAGGKLLCYVLPAAAAVVAGLIVADVASDDFDLITVER